jgi:teichuronic acid exporter
LRLPTNFSSISLKAVKWSFLERFSQQAMQFIVSIMLARILMPEDFGLVAMVSVFIALGNSFIDSGFQKALIQKKVLTYVDECSVFYFNVLLAIIVTGIMFLSANVISNYYDQPKLIKITQALSILFLFSSLGLIQDTLLIRKLDYKRIFAVNTLAYTLAAGTSIIMAFRNYGVWSLVVLNVGSTVFRTILLWIIGTWRPSFKFSHNSLKSMYAFGSHLFIVSVLNSVFTNIYQIIIGKYFSPAELGYYSRAKTLSNYPVMLVSNVINQVSFPIFSRMQDDSILLKHYVRKSLRLLTSITFPLMFGAIVVAEPLITVLLTAKWIASAHYFQLLCVVGMIYPILVVNLNALNARGRSDLFLRINIINKIMVILTIVITFRYGIIMLILGQIFNSIITYYLYSFYSGKHLNYNVRMQIIDIYPNIFASIGMSIIVYSISFMQISNQFILLAIQILSGVISYIGICYYFEISAVFEVLRLFIKMIANPKVST